MNLRNILWKNYLIKKRHPIASIMEVVIPILFVILFNYFKTLSTANTIPTGFSSAGGDSSKGISHNLFNWYAMDGSAFWNTDDVSNPILPQFVATETTLSGILTLISWLSVANSGNFTTLPNDLQTSCRNKLVFQGFVNHDPTAEFALPEECQNKVIPYKIGIAPDNDFTRKYFYSTVSKWYPRTELTSSGSFAVPAFNDSVMWFKSIDDMDDYIKGPKYAMDTNHPKVYAGIAFEKHPEGNAIGAFDSIEYAIRLNSTMDDGRGTMDVPSTSELDSPNVNPLQKMIKAQSMQEFATFGFATLQTLVNRFIICLPEWDSNDKTTTGACQITASVAKNTPDLNQRFFDHLKQDTILNPAIATYNSRAKGESVDLNAIPAAQKELLLQGLRQAPQPYFTSLHAPFPIYGYKSEEFYNLVKNVLPLLFLMAYMNSLSKLLKALIFEKESKARELIKIMGANEYIIILGWYITYTIVAFTTALFQAIFATMGLFSNSNFVLIFLLFFLFSLDVIAFAYMVSTIFSSSKIGSMVGIAVFFMLYLASSGATESTPEATKTLYSILAPSALSFGIQSVASAEASGVGITFDTASELYGNYRFSTALWFMVLDFLLYTGMGLYLEQVIPKEYGTRKPWNFIFMPKYWTWCGSKNKEASVQSNADNVAVSISPSDSIEAVSNELRAQEVNNKALIVKDLRKVFSVPGGEKVAVDSLDLKLYEGQITCLLGHNGAGKTTIISMLTGMTAPSSGDATICGKSLVNDIGEIRKSMGMCPQHDVLYPELTVREHLIFFGSLNGNKGNELMKEVDRKIEEVGLTEKANSFSTDLSGGMKRKLSVAIALLGNSKVVFLDEPTSGMDPYSRRATWELLQNNRHGRIMVLTTHFMDEADLLGDRIAIMADGKLRCCGSSLFLKNRYGVGYNLTMVKEENCDVESTIALVKSHVVKATILSNVGAEIAFQLPLESSSSFPSLFNELDDKLTSLKIAQYGISVTTLEEVFLKVAEEGDIQAQESLKGSSSKSLTSAEQECPAEPTTQYKVSTDPQSWISMLSVHVHALLLKRFNIAKRDKRAVMFSICLPIVILIFGFAVLTAGSFSKDEPKLDLSTQDFEFGQNTPASFYCHQSVEELCQGMGTDNLLGATGVKISAKEFGEPPYQTNTPNVFGHQYENPSINATGTTGYMLRMSESSFKTAYGSSSAQPIFGQYGAYLLHASDDAVGYNVLVNTTSKHALPIFKSIMDQSIYRTLGSKLSGNRNKAPSIKVSNHPLPLTSSTKALFGSFLSLMAVIFIVIAFAFVPASVVTTIVKEKESHQNSKHQQLVSGVSLPAFWLAHYIWDFAMYLIPGTSALILIQAFDLTSFTGNSTCLHNCTTDIFGAVVVLFLMFGLAVIPFSYVISNLFKQHSSAQILTLMMNFVLGMLLMIVSFVLQLIESTKDINDTLKFLWRLSPMYCLGGGLLNLSIKEITINFALSSNSVSAFDLDVMGWEILFLGIQAILFFSMAIGIDLFLSFPKLQSLIFRDPQIKSVKLDDVDVVVQKEEDRIKQGNLSDLIQVRGLRKVYKGGKIAVRNLHFGLKKGECFGFLGINGAGKTTTMKMLTGDVLPTSGDGQLSSHSILSEQIAIRRLIGYCPQFDALLDLLSVREHLELFGRIKGIPAKQLEGAVMEKLHQMDLTKFETKLAGSLSGGNKRKLSVAIAMMGSPSIIFLDEPSTGMDPKARRFMWKVIADISTSTGESTIVLTTHSMEECEALCSKVGIMVGGRLRCYGSVQHLKGRFGDGLMMEVTLNVASDEILTTMVNSDLEGLRELSRADIDRISKATKHHEMKSRISSTDATGWQIHECIERDDVVPATDFAAWWIGEQRFKTLNDFIDKNYPASSILERHGDHCRYKIVGNFRLSSIFETMEANRTDLHIKEYSVSQTSLEQIFNHFASQQDEEKGVARGMNKTIVGSGP